MCYFHVTKNVKEYFHGSGKKKLSARVRRDISVLQLSRSPEEFAKASSLFVEKWKKDKSAKTFVDYFRKQYLVGPKSFER